MVPSAFHAVRALPNDQRHCTASASHAGPPEKPVQGHPCHSHTAHSGPYPTRGAVPNSRSTGLACDVYDCLEVALAKLVLQPQRPAHALEQHVEILQAHGRPPAALSSISLPCCPEGRCLHARSDTAGNPKISTQLLIAPCPPAHSLALGPHHRLQPIGTSGKLGDAVCLFHHRVRHRFVEPCSSQRVSQQN